MAGVLTYLGGRQALLEHVVYLPAFPSVEIERDLLARTSQHPGRRVTH